jgi:hypothetical protein
VAYNGVVKSSSLSLTLLGVAVLAGCGGGSSVRVGKFAGDWGGHDRALAISREGRGVETIDSGCCHHAVTLRFRLTRVSGTTKRPTARAVVSYVHVYPGAGFTKKYPPPHVGEVGTLRIVKGVLYEPLGTQGDTYCNRETAKLSDALAPCGA